MIAARIFEILVDFDMQSDRIVTMKKEIRRFECEMKMIIKTYFCHKTGMVRIKWIFTKNN
jgi:hypothetical protein